MHASQAVKDRNLKYYHDPHHDPHHDPYRAYDDSHVPIGPRLIHRSGSEVLTRDHDGWCLLLFQISTAVVSSCRLCLFGCGCSWRSVCSRCVFHVMMR